MNIYIETFMQNITIDDAFEGYVSQIHYLYVEKLGQLKYIYNNIKHNLYIPIKADKFMYEKLNNAHISKGSQRP